MSASGVLVHRLPGRVRVRIDGRRGDPKYFTDLSEDISRLPGVDRVKANPSTASVVIEFSETTENLMQQLHDNNLSVDLPVESRDTPAGQARQDAERASTHPFHLVSNRELNPMFMLGAVFAVLGVVQTFRGKILVPSLSVLWYAMEAFRQSGVTRAAADGEEVRHAGRDAVSGKDDMLH